MSNTNNPTSDVFTRPRKPMEGFDIFRAVCSAKGRWRKGELLDTVFYVKGRMSEDEVRDSEIRHFPGCAIMVRKQRSKRMKGVK